jgi:nucleotide-binding universal stress UspA family protein
MGIYRQILVALDRTPLSEPVFQQACALATQNQAKLLLLHCFTLPHSSQVDDGDRYRANLNHFLELAQQQLASSMEDIRQWLSAYAHDAETQGIAVDWDWRLGESGPEICDAARCACGRSDCDRTAGTPGYPRSAVGQRQQLRCASGPLLGAGGAGPKLVPP